MSEPRGVETWAMYGSLVVLTAVLGVAVGPAGVLAGIVTAAAWYVLGVPYALAAGHVVLVALTPESLEPVTIGIVALAFVTLPLAASLRTPVPSVAGGVVIAGTLGLGAIVALMEGQRPWITALTLVATLALVAYGTHRYELVSHGLVSDADDRQSTTRNDS